MTSQNSNNEHVLYRGEALAVRSIVGGLLMGLANLVPGISGGTMLLAVGAYPQFINGVAELSTFRFRPATILTLACIVGAALLAIVTLAGPVSELVVHHRWAMYSLFIGLTLGGVPILWKLVKPADSVLVLTSIIGIAVMAAMAMIGPAGASSSSSGGSDSHAYAFYFLGGLAGASAMVLPGISGGYLLLVLGQYVTILSAVAALKNGAGSGDWETVAQALRILVPVGLGVVMGVVGVSNLIKVMLEKFERPTLGILLGLLLGAVIGLWPFQQGVAPEPGDTFRGDVVALDEQSQLIMQSTGRIIEAKDYDTAFFTPTLQQVAGSIALIVAGFAVSIGVSHLGSGKEKSGKEHA